MKSWIRSLNSAKKRKVAIIGGKGSGKSTANFSLMLALVIKGNCRILVTCGTRDQVLKLFKQKIAPELAHIPVTSANNQTLIYNFVTGAEIHLKSVENFKTAEGLEYDAWFADEIQDHSEEAVKVFHSRTRRAKEKSLFRIVGMPDDPEHFMYKYFDENKYCLHEITLFDNPSPEFVSFYEKELRKIYFGAELQRFLYGKRVSLSGLGLFAIGQEHRKEIAYDSKKEVMFSWDFNNEYRAVTVWQWDKIDGVNYCYCVDALQMKETTPFEDAISLAQTYKNASSMIYLIGDASGDNKQASATKSMWRMVRDGFSETLKREIRYLTPRSNPNVKDTILCCNYAFAKNRVYFNEKSIRAFRSMVAAKADKFGEVDKSKDYSNSEVKSHEVDTVRYALWWLIDDFPGKRKSSGGAALL